MTNAFKNLLDDFEDLVNSVGTGASWGGYTYLRVNGFALFNKNGGERTLGIRCDEHWTLTDVPSWVKVSQTNGNGDGDITITASAYTGNEPRTATMYVKSGYANSKILVMQLPTESGNKYDDPAAVIEGCYSYDGEKGGFLTLSHMSANTVRMTYYYDKKYGVEITAPVDFTITQTPEGIIYLKGINAEGSYYVQENYSWTKHLYLIFHDGDNDRMVFLQKKENAKGSGALADPLNAAGASAYAEYVGRYNESLRDVYIKGKVASISENYGTMYGNATFKISDDGTENNSFYIYRALYLGNRKYTSGDLLKEDDEVIICGKVTNYQGNTPETVQGKAYLYSLNGKTPKKIWIYGQDPVTQPPFTPGAWDAPAMRFSDTEGAHLPTIPDDVYFGLKTLIFDVSDVSEDFDLRVMNGWWSNTYYDHVKWESGLNVIQITETMANECAKGGEGHDLDLMLYSGSMTLNAVYYEEY